MRTNRRRKVTTDSINIIKVHVRPIDWTYGNVYGIRGQFTGEFPAMTLMFGDGGKGDDIGFYAWDLDVRHEYPKDPSQSYIVELTLSPDTIIDHIEPCCGDCEYEFVDLSGAPDIVSAYIKRCKGVRLNNRRMEKLELNIENFPFVDFFRCFNLRELTFSGGEAVKEPDLETNCRLERLVIKGYSSSGLRNIKLSNNTPLKYVDVTGARLHPSCRDAIRRIVERNDGVFIDGHKSEFDEE